MERDANYTVVGAFVVLVVVMAGLFVYWYSAATEHRDFTRYEIYFDGSVFGLTRGGSVRYLGVEVGRVASLRVDTRAATRVQVTVDIDADTPISDKTLAELSLQGITGLLYIDLFQNDGTKQAAPAVPSQRYPVIRSARSTLEAFVQSLPELVGRVGEVASRAAQALSDDNIGALNATLRNIDRATAHLPQTMAQIDALVGDLHGTSADVRSVAADLRALSEDSAPELRATVQRIHEVADHLADTTGRLDQMVADNRDDIREFARDGLPEVEALVRDGRAAAQEFKALAESLRENPSRLIYQPTPSGLQIPP
jgi:phospholipid/cholesterol/gamma-HCH transport system substrate-binding protein